MKNRLVTGIAVIVLGLLIAVGPSTIFPVCGVRDTGGSAMLGVQSDNGAMSGTGEDSSGDPVESSGHSSNSSSSTVMKCHWTAQALLGVGILIAILGALLIVFASKQVRLGLSIALALNGILAFLIPNVLIGVCGSAHMLCRTLTLPANSVISGIAVVAAIANAAYLWKADRGENN